MAGLDQDTPTPTDIKLHQASHLFEIAFDNGESYRLPYEYLRVYSPSAEVRGHGPGQEVLQTGKRQVGVVGIDQIGHYALRIRFDDGHDSGIYSWDLLYDLARGHEPLWQNYLDRLAAAGASRDPDPNAAPAASSQGCGSGSCGCH